MHPLLKALFDIFLSSQNNKKDNVSLDEKKSLSSQNHDLEAAPLELGELPLLKREKLKKALAKRESSNNQFAINSIGYIGLYQFGSAALEDLGYIKPQSWAKFKNRALDMSECWAGKDDIKDKQDFLNNRQIQELCMDRMLKINYHRLKRLKIDMDNKEHPVVAGLLAVAHLLGAGGARDFYNGIDKADAYGSKASEYYQLGVNSVS